MDNKFLLAATNAYGNGQERGHLISLPRWVGDFIYDKSNVKLKVGMSEIEVEYKLNNTKNTIEIPEYLVEELGLQDKMEINYKIKNNKLSLGPVIGVFQSNGSVRKANLQNANFRFIELMKANKSCSTILYFFSVHDVDFEHKKINGTFFNEETERWEKKLYPYPDILYDRGGGTLKSQKMISDNIRKELEGTEDFKKINAEYFFDKWHAYNELIKYKEMTKYLPLTILYNKPEDLTKMLNLSSTLYLKDCLGNNGVGVVRLIKHSEESYELSHFMGTSFKFDIDSFDNLISKIEELFKDKRFIIQIAIDVLQLGNRNIDMRATVQKNGRGNLGVTAFPVRLGKEECPITSTRSGSSVYTIEEFFKKNYNFTENQIDQLEMQLRRFLFTIFSCLEKSYGSFGEIGIDFAIDKNWRIWFIECNAKPGKDTLYISYDNDTIQKAFINPLEYAKYLWIK